MRTHDTGQPQELINACSPQRVESDTQQKVKFSSVGLPADQAMQIVQLPSSTTITNILLSCEVVAVYFLTFSRSSIHGHGFNSPPHQATQLLGLLRRFHRRSSCLHRDARDNRLVSKSSKCCGTRYVRPRKSCEQQRHARQLH